MNEDSSRSRLDVKLYCSKHTENELSLSTQSKIVANSAYEINANILVHPCSICKQEVERIENAVNILKSFAFADSDT